MQVKACAAFTFCPKIQGLLGVKLQLADQELDLTLIDCYNRMNSWSIWSRPIHQSIGQDTYILAAERVGNRSTYYSLIKCSHITETGTRADSKKQGQLYLTMDHDVGGERLTRRFLLGVSRFFRIYLQFSII
jgi:hypothetical protein